MNFLTAACQPSRTCGRVYAQALHRMFTVMSPGWLVEDRAVSIKAIRKLKRWLQTAYLLSSLGPPGHAVASSKGRCDVGQQGMRATFLADTRLEAAACLVRPRNAGQTLARGGWAKVNFPTAERSLKRPLHDPNRASGESCPCRSRVGRVRHECVAFYRATNLLGVGPGRKTGICAASHAPMESMLRTTRRDLGAFPGLHYLPRQRLDRHSRRFSH